MTKTNNQLEQHYAWLSVCFVNNGLLDVLQIEGADGADAHPLGTEYYTTLRSEADNEVTAATVASEEAEAEIGRQGTAVKFQCHDAHFIFLSAEI